eukprot:1279507-Rhodomonas_salina.1
MPTGLELVDFVLFCFVFVPLHPFTYKTKTAWYKNNLLYDPHAIVKLDSWINTYHHTKHGRSSYQQPEYPGVGWCQYPDTPGTRVPRVVTRCQIQRRRNILTIAGSQRNAPDRNSICLLTEISARRTHKARLSFVTPDYPGTAIVNARQRSFRLWALQPKSKLVGPGLRVPLTRPSCA